ncbi:hypothetical protein BTR14_01585 [Rhizobium rhizosphaerae]|uniref:AAA+ ATPase domain-containing protein n=1 Tax=Xaviernesmea rhizosphaerae TaxID=1672749 RepID=A0ABX3PI30_9HYPH|nr:AAA family ATPase [Xaviernesmea rhizosphaerae]OQP88175.1 hypothetical protein BTR14_01585 [Xaviernesmea rhizosphaerae]
MADLNGLGAVKEWGLELAMDLSDFRSGLISWDDVDNGALVSGPPGTGKTLFAEALARTCDIPIVAVSAAQWQTAGYLNDMLKAMRESFGEAQSKGPALLFVDELDAVGSRMINDSRNADYKRQVINGLLELLDGFERRSGVVVLGATNHPENIDPAILRAGRLDRHFFLSLPDAATRRQIFTFHADFSIPEEQEDGFARSTAGMSGADIKQLVRDGRRVARRQGEKFGFEHIVKVATPLLALPSEHMRVAAYHEAGHAIVGVDLGMKLQGISINERVLSVGLDTLGGASFASDPFALKTRSFYCGLIAMYLGGLAAETIIFGEFTDAVANDPRSDLAMATELATRMVACLGMGRTLAIDAVAARDLGRLRAADRRLRMAVDEVLERQFTTATEILEHRGRALCAVAETLLNRKSMSASEVSEVLDSYPATCGDAMEGEIGDSVTLKA